MSTLHRRTFIATGGAAIALAAGLPKGVAATAGTEIVTPPNDRRLLLSCKLTMIARKLNGKKLSLAKRLQLAKQAGFDGVDLDEAGAFSPVEARQAVEASGVFVHNAINHAHWKKRFTSPDPDERLAARANLEHCLRVSHAAGGSGVLIVVGHGNDGTRQEVEDRCYEELSQMLPIAASLGQPILIENVWNQMFYDHDQPAEQSAERFAKFIDRFNSPWIGLYYDIGNHWKYGQPAEWLRQLGRRCIKLDIKGFSRAKNEFTDIGQGDLPWDQVRQGLAEIGFTGWATAEVKGGGLERLQQIRQQMAAALYGEDA